MIVHGVLQLSGPPQPLRIQIFSLTSFLFTHPKLHGITALSQKLCTYSFSAETILPPDLHPAHSLSSFSSLLKCHLLEVFPDRPT